jgi:hypothetical protein
LSVARENEVLGDGAPSSRIPGHIRAKSHEQDCTEQHTRAPSSLNGFHRH